MFHCIILAYHNTCDIFQLMLALAQMSMILNATFFTLVLQDYKNDMERHLEEKIAESRFKDGSRDHWHKGARSVNFRCIAWTTPSKKDLQDAPFFIEMMDHVWWNFTVFSIVIPQENSHFMMQPSIIPSSSGRAVI